MDYENEFDKRFGEGRQANGAIDAPKIKPGPTGNQRAGLGADRPASKGKGFRMGNKLQITLMTVEDLVDQVDEVAKSLGESRATVINRAIREYLARLKAT